MRGDAGGEDRTVEEDHDPKLGPAKGGLEGCGLYGERGSVETGVMGGATAWTLLLFGGAGAAELSAATFATAAAAAAAVADLDEEDETVLCSRARRAAVTAGEGSSLDEAVPSASETEVDAEGGCIVSPSGAALTGRDDCEATCCC